MMYRELLELDSACVCWQTKLLRAVTWGGTLQFQVPFSVRFSNHGRLLATGC